MGVGDEGRGGVTGLVHVVLRVDMVFEEHTKAYTLHIIFARYTHTAQSLSLHILTCWLASGGRCTPALNVGPQLRRGGHRRRFGSRLAHDHLQHGAGRPRGLAAALALCLGRAGHRRGEDVVGAAATWRRGK